MKNAVEFNNIYVIFGNRQKETLKLLSSGKTRDEIASLTNDIIGVADVSFDVPKGEICVLMGLSGSGKSSLLRCINGLNTITSGSLRVQSGNKMIDVTTCNSATLRKLRRTSVAMVFQHFGLFPWRTVEENVEFGLELNDMSSKDRYKIIQEKLALVGLQQWGKKYTHELSGGMQQRVGLARAFATDAPILLMDEPFSALDPLIRSHLQDELITLQNKLNKTIIFVSHDLDEAMKLGNSIVIMEGGHIVQHGTPEDIALRPVNEYVSNFVAHMNPVHILHARSIMHKFSDDECAASGELHINRFPCPITIFLENGIINSIHNLEFGELKIVKNIDNISKNLDKPNNTIVFVTNENILLKDLILMRSLTQNPIFLTYNGRISGIIGRKEFFRSFIQKGEE